MQLQSNGVSNTCLQLDSKTVATRGTSKTLIPLALPGCHTLTLTNGHGKILDMHQFVVRALNIPRDSP